MGLKKTIKSIPVVGPTVTRISLWIQRKPFRNSRDFWEERYAEGGTSGTGSYDRLAEFKAEVINRFVKEHNVRSVIELGCGDGNQLKLGDYPEYLGTDVAQSAIDRCEKMFEADTSKSFLKIDTGRPLKGQVDKAYDLSMSLDVIYHLVEQEIFEKHLRDLFDVSNRYVIIYSSDVDSKHMYHEKHRQFTKWVDTNIKGWKLIKKLDNKFPYDPESPDDTSKADFYFYEKV